MFSWGNGKGWRQGEPPFPEIFHSRKILVAPSPLPPEWQCPVGATGVHQTPPWMPHKPCYLSGDPISTLAPHHSCMVGPGLWAAQTDKVVNLNALLILWGNKGVVQVTALKKYFTKSSLCSTCTVSLDQYKIQFHLIQKKHQHVVIVTRITNVFLRSVAKMWQRCSRQS